MVESLFPVLFVSMFLFVPLVASQCITNADVDCDGTVNQTELIGYIQLWYACSSCHPDMFEAIEAWFEGQQQLDGAEDIEVELRPLAEIPGLIARGRISHALVVVAFTYLLGLDPKRLDPAQLVPGALENLTGT